MALTRSDIGDLYLAEEMKALKCIRNAVDALDATDPVGFRFWLEEAVYHGTQMTNFKRKFEAMLGEDWNYEAGSR